MPTVDDVQFDTTGWELRESVTNRMVWTNSVGDVLTKRFNPEPPKMPGLFRTPELFQYYHQQVTASGGALLSTELLHVKGVAVSKLLFKALQGERFGFVGALTLAYREFSYSIRIQTLERAGDENRIRRAMQELEASQPAGTDLRQLWFGEAISDGGSPVRRCLADDEIWDTEFPQHPLSRLRAELFRLLPTLQISRDVKNSVPHNA